MFCKSLFRFVAALAALTLLLSTAQAVTIDLVPVRNPGNAGQFSGGGYAPGRICGGVDYVYSIGKYEMTNAQWREFLTAKASLGDPYLLYSPGMAKQFGGIDRSGSGSVEDPYVYSSKGADPAWDNRPVNFVSFWDAARFCNWLHNGQGTGDTESGAYINIGNQSTFARQPGALFFIPTEDEWYKAAYHQNDGVTGNYYDYPTSSDSVPSNDLIDPDPGNNANFYQGDWTIGNPYYTTEVGEFENSESPYGTFDQGGNFAEWNETTMDSWRGIRGSYWNEISLYFHADYRRRGLIPTYEHDGLGFRVAASSAVIPEPGSVLVWAGLAVAGLMWWRRRR